MYSEDDWWIWMLCTAGWLPQGSENRLKGASLHLHNNQQRWRCYRLLFFPGRDAISKAAVIIQVSCRNSRPPADVIGGTFCVLFANTSIAAPGHAPRCNDRALWWPDVGARAEPVGQQWSNIVCLAPCQDCSHIPSLFMQRGWTWCCHGASVTALLY